MENVLESWAEIAITVKTEDIETAGNIANMVVPYGIYIEDYSALEEDAAEISHYDFIDEALLNKDKTHGIIHIYVNPHENPMEAASFITERLSIENIEHELNIADCRTEDWVNNWKQYFHAMPIGEKLLIRPKHLKNTLTIIQPFLTSAAAAVFCLSLRFCLVRNLPLVWT